MPPPRRHCRICSLPSWRSFHDDEYRIESIRWVDYYQQIIWLVFAFFYLPAKYFRIVIFTESTRIIRFSFITARDFPSSFILFITVIAVIIYHCRLPILPGIFSHFCFSAFHAGYSHHLNIYWAAVIITASSLIRRHLDECAIYTTLRKPSRDAERRRRFSFFQPLESHADAIYYYFLDIFFDYCQLERCLSRMPFSSFRNISFSEDDVIWEGAYKIFGYIIIFTFTVNGCQQFYVVKNTYHISAATPLHLDSLWFSSVLRFRHAVIHDFHAFSYTRHWYHYHRWNE